MEKSIAPAERSDEHLVAARDLLDWTPAMRLATTLLATTLLLSNLLACPARADDPILYRRIRFGNALKAGRISACSVQFGIGFRDPSAPPRRGDDVDGEITFSRRDGRLSAVMTMRAFGDYTTKFTGIGQIADVALTGGDDAVRLEQDTSRADPAREALPPDRVSDLLTILNGNATLSFTLSNPIRSFAFPFALADAGCGADDALVSAGRAVFDDCMAALTRDPG